MELSYGTQLRARVHAPGSILALLRGEECRTLCRRGFLHRPGTKCLRKWLLKKHVAGVSRACASYELREAFFFLLLLKHMFFAKVASIVLLVEQEALRFAIDERDADAPSRIPLSPC